MREFQRVSRGARLYGVLLLHETVTNCMDEIAWTDWEMKRIIIVRYEIVKKGPLPLVCH